MPLDLGWNEIVVTTHDKAGKEGSVKIRINRQTSCT